MRQNLSIGLGLVLGIVSIWMLIPHVHAQTPPATPSAATTLEQRVAQRKAERNITLTQPETSRVVSQCIGAQGNLRKLQQETTVLAQARSTVYRNIDGKLWVAIGRLKLAGKDTFELEKKRADLAAKVGAFQAGLTVYQQTLDDGALINCKADPVGFKAIIETARIYYGQVQGHSSDIRAFVVNDIKTSLANHATDLKPKEGGSN